MQLSFAIISSLTAVLSASLLHVNSTPLSFFPYLSAWLAAKKDHLRRLRTTHPILSPNRFSWWCIIYLMHEKYTATLNEPERSASFFSCSVSAVFTEVSCAQKQNTRERWLQMFGSHSRIRTCRKQNWATDITTLICRGIPAVHQLAKSEHTTMNEGGNAKTVKTA